MNWGQGRHMRARGSATSIFKKEMPIGAEPLRRAAAKIH